MRFLYFLFLVVFLAAVGLFAWQNQQTLTISFWEWEVTASVAEIVGAAYVLGMLSGWTVVGMLRRSWNSVAAEMERRRAGLTL